MRFLALSSIAAFSALLFACNSDSTTDAGPTDAGPGVDAGTDAGHPDLGGSVDSGPVDSGTHADSGPVDSGPVVDGGAMVTLTVNDYLGWCNVTVNGGAVMTIPQTVMVAPGTVVHVNAVPNGIFVWGYWTGTSGDTTAAHDMSMMTTVTVNTNTTIQACCPDPPPAAPTCL